MKRLPSLDGFRAISIILVLIAHSRFSNGFPLRYYGLAQHGAAGVTVFFVISGFLITYLLLNEQSKFGHISLKQFYTNRALRILPVFLLYTLVILCWNSYHYVGLTPSDIIHTLTFTVNFVHAPKWLIGHLWTLSIEEQFYVFWPAMMILFRKHSKILLYVLICYSCITRVITYRFPDYQIIALSPFFNYSDSIFIGALGGIIFFENPAICDQKIFRSYLAQFFALFLIVAFIYFLGYGRFGKIAVPFGNLVISASILFLLLAYVKPNDSVIYKILNSRLFVHIGILSYSLYIWQEIFVTGDGIWRAFPLTIPIIYGVSLVSYYAWERPFLKIKTYISKNRLQPFN